MATITLTICDYCDPEEQVPAEKVTLALDGQSRELDICTTHREELEAMLAPWLDAARKIAAPKRTYRRRATTAVVTPSVPATTAPAKAPAKKAAKKTPTKRVRKAVEPAADIAAD